MIAFTPQQGDYFEAKDLTEEQFYKIRALYMPHVKCADRYSPTVRYVGWDYRDEFAGWNKSSNYKATPFRLLTYQDVFPDPFPNMHVCENSIGWDLPDGDIPHGDFIQPAPKPEENKMIDWSEPIETSSGNFAAFVKMEDGRYLCAVHTNDNTERDLFISKFNEDGTNSQGRGRITVRNKPELIKPHGWVAFSRDTGQVVGCSDSLDNMGECPEWIVKDVNDLMSGKFKDGIPKGYVSS